MIGTAPRRAWIGVIVATVGLGTAAADEPRLVDAAMRADGVAVRA
jgi:hypothetical protein